MIPARIRTTAAVLLVILAQALCSGRAGAQTPAWPGRQPVEYFDVPVNIQTPIEPTPVKGVDGKWYLVYHLLLTNWSFSDLTLKSVEVSDAAGRRLLLRYGDKELADYYRFRSLIPTPPRSEMPVLNTVIRFP